MDGMGFHLCDAIMCFSALYLSWHMYDVCLKGYVHDSCTTGCDYFGNLLSGHKQLFSSQSAAGLKEYKCVIILLEWVCAQVCSIAKDRCLS